jgi:cytochrome c-type biogenesis protein CcmH
VAGDSDGKVIDFLVARYGEFVLLQPRFEPRTLLLWLLPPLVLAGGGAALWRQGRRYAIRAAADDHSSNNRPADALTADEQARLQRLIAETSPSEAR